MRIRRLDPTLANQIAAGEVVERPASVLKELLENSVDAGADRVEVEVERGGSKLLRVRDNGAGIHRDDLVLALRRHATSKIRSFDDLRRIGSLGFRGEALPSISSVSRLALVSRTPGDENGWRVEAAGSAEVSDPVPAVHATGTTVEVRELFFNTPARREVLRTEKTEFRHLESMVRVLALGHPRVDIALVHNARPLFRLRAAAGERDGDARVAKLCGRRFLEHSLRVEFEDGGLALRGWVAGPGLEPRVSNPQYLFVNARAVRDPVIRHAVRAACAHWLGADRQPAYVLDLSLPAAEVDVNVHPTKHEVRFRDSRLIHDFVVHCLRGLGGNSLLPGGLDGEPGRRLAPYPRSEAGAAAGGVAEVADPPRTYQIPRPSRGGAWSDPQSSDAAEHGATVLGPLDGRFAMVAVDGGVRIVDVVAARRTMLIARLEDAVSAGAAASRPFLVPESGALAASAADCFEVHEDVLLRLGFEYRRVAAERIMLREAPLALAGFAPVPLVTALAASLPALGDEDEDCRVRVLIRRMVANLEVPLNWPQVGALLKDLEALSSRPESGPDRDWAELSGADVAALFEAARRK